MTDETALASDADMVKVANDLEAIIKSRIGYSIDRSGVVSANVRLLAECISGYIHHDVLAAWSSRAPAQDERAPMEFPYTATFQAIADAVEIHGPNTLSISVEKFQESWNRRMSDRDADRDREGAR